MKEFNVVPDDNNVLSLLKKINRFNKISDKDLQLFIKAGKIREYEPKETIIKEGNIDSWAYFLLSGTLKIQKKGADIGTLKRLGDVFGEMDSLGGTSKTTSVISDSKSIILAIDTSFVNKQLEGEEIYFSYMIYRIFAEVQAVRLLDQIQENEKLKTELTNIKKGVKTAKNSMGKVVEIDLYGKKILLVDHKESTRKMLKTILTTELNCNNVFEVVSGEKAVIFLIENTVDLIVAELNMPDMSGLDLRDNVKKMLSVKDIPFIIYCSESKSSIDKIKKAADDGITHYKSTQCMILPFTANTVIEKVKNTFLKANKK